ncbi:hypothetical protein [Bailinhaonella thermotolerans]|uniref:hypothetical protein n=1 Tax=Bailinhaonella thermotolerans TaxID=1070861 RepID=UPI0011C3AB0E|nr:hypothetical protein [Bailinhaonella thermotolerans]
MSTPPIPEASRRSPPGLPDNPRRRGQALDVRGLTALSRDAVERYGGYGGGGQMGVIRANGY